MQSKTKHTQTRREFTVTGQEVLLPFLLQQVEGKSRNTVKALLTRRQVLVNGKPITRHDFNLRAGQIVTVLPATQAAPPPLPFAILYEDDELIAIDKPAGLLSIGSDKEREHTAYRMVTDYVKVANPQNRLFVLHRLDQDTSGVLLFAKNEVLKHAVQENWDKLVTLRSYLAVVEGHPPKAEDTLHSWLKETVSHLVYTVDSPRGGAKEAITHYSTVSSSGRYTLLEARLETGRKNQIRVQFQEMGNPVAGDKKYGAKTNPIGRLALHASRLVIKHPKTGKEYIFAAPKPRMFRRLTVEADQR